MGLKKFLGHVVGLKKISWTHGAQKNFLDMAWHGAQKNFLDTAWLVL